MDGPAGARRVRRQRGRPARNVRRPRRDGPHSAARPLLLLLRGGDAGRAVPWARPSCWPTWPPGTRRGHGGAGGAGPRGAPARRCGRGRGARRPSGSSAARSPSSSTGTRRTGPSWWRAARRGCGRISSSRPRASSSRRSTPRGSWPGSCSTTRRSSRWARRATSWACGSGSRTTSPSGWRRRPSAPRDRALTEAIAYTSERIVFDKPVATYQTVRHRLVEMFQQVEMARAGFQFAAWASDTESPERAQAAAMASSYAADAGVRVTGDDIQLHGGVGFTWANDAHFLFKRVKQNELLAGGAGAAAPPAGDALHRIGMTTFELRPMPAELAERYRAEGAWDDRTLGEFLRDCLLEDPSAALPHLVADPPPPRDRRRGLRGVAARGGRLACPRARAGRRGGLPAAQLGRGGHHLLRLRHARRDAGADRALLRPQGGRLHPPPERGQGAASSCRASASATTWPTWRRCATGWRAWSRSWWWATSRRRRVRVRPLRRACATRSPIDGPAHVDPDGAAVIGYTSGTTADPKGVVHTHRTLGCEVRQLSDHQSMRDLPSLVGAPVGHAIGMLGGLLCPLYSGRPDLHDRRLGPAHGPRRHGGGAHLRRERLHVLLHEPARLPRASGPSTSNSCATSGLGGSPIPNAVAERADELGISLVRSYGSTEHPSITGSQHDAPKEKRIHTDGRPMAWVEIRTVDEDGHDVGVGQPGEILSRGPDRFAGYTDAALTAEAVDADGWFSTGDIGVIDEDGYLTITDRVKDIIIRGGENVERGRGRAAPGAHEGRGRGGGGGGTRRAARRARLRVLPHAAGERSRRTSRPCGRTCSAAGLTRQKWPEEIRIVDELPRTPSGKIQKFVLRQRLREGG